MIAFDEAYETIPGNGWLKKEEAASLWKWASASHGRILEVGCYEGRSTCLLAQLGRPMICVDPFAGFSTDDPGGDAVHAAWLRNIMDRGFADMITLHKKRIEEWQPESCGFAFLDGDHTEAGTKAQIGAALLAGVGSFCLHDYSHSGGGRAIVRAANVFVESGMIARRGVACTLAAFAVLPRRYDAGRA